MKSNKKAVVDNPSIPFIHLHIKKLILKVINSFFEIDDKKEEVSARNQRRQNMNRNEV